MTRTTVLCNPNVFLVTFLGRNLHDYYDCKKKCLVFYQFLGHYKTCSNQFLYKTVSSIHTE